MQNSLIFIHIPYLFHAWFVQVPLKLYPWLIYLSCMIRICFMCGSCMFHIRKRPLFIYESGHFPYTFHVQSLHDILCMNRTRIFVCDSYMIVQYGKSRIRRAIKNEGAAALAEHNHKNAWKYIKAATFTTNKCKEFYLDASTLNDYFASIVSIIILQRTPPLRARVAVMEPIASPSRACLLRQSRTR